MLKRLEFKEHGIDIAVDTSKILCVSLDSEKIDGGLEIYFTTICFSDANCPQKSLVGDRAKDKLAVRKMHAEILRLITE